MMKINKIFKKYRQHNNMIKIVWEDEDSGDMRSSIEKVKSVEKIRPYHYIIKTTEDEYEVSHSSGGNDYKFRKAYHKRDFSNITIILDEFDGFYYCK